MNNKINTTIFKIFTAILALFLFNLIAFPKIIANISEIAYKEPGKTQIRLNVIDAAGFFLKSQSDSLLLLNKIELADSYGVSFPELRDIVTNAISNMENAKTVYSGLVKFSKTAPYNKPVIDKLITFDYVLFRETTGVNGGIAEKVEDYLSLGDVNGIYSQLLSNSQYILDKLNIIQSALLSNTIPTNSALWRLNQSFSETLLFGQYTAEIFYDITGN